METPEEFLKKYLDSTEGNAVKTLSVFTIRKTPTKVDDNILRDADQCSNVIAASLKEMQNQNPTPKEALKAGVVLIEKISGQINNKWLNMVISLLKKFVK